MHDTEVSLFISFLFVLFVCYCFTSFFRTYKYFKIVMKIDILFLLPEEYFISQSSSTEPLEPF